MTFCRNRRFCKRWLTSILVVVGFLWCQTHFDILVAAARYYLSHEASGPTLPLSEDFSNETCEIPPFIFYGVPWPKCQLHMSSLTHGNYQAPCFNEFVREGDVCSNLRYLSEVKRYCPPLMKSRHSAQFLYKGEKAIVQIDFDELYLQMLVHTDYRWMIKRIQRMEKLWINAANMQFQPGSPPMTKKRIHVHPGLLQWGVGEPSGALVQWSDLLASLHIIGHDVVLTRDLQGVMDLYHDFLERSRESCYKSSGKIPFDLIYTDIIGYREMLGGVFDGTEVVEDFKCRIRIVDSWGTEADFNDPEYVAKRSQKLSFYGGLGLDLRQFNTLYPHTPDNTFLGFVIEKVRTELPPHERNIALLYGKKKESFVGKLRYIDMLGEYFNEVHATIHHWMQQPKHVINHAILTPDEFAELLGRTKVFVGFGSPYEAPGALEAIQLGAIFLNRKIRMPLVDHPTSRVLTSQNTYAENIGKPYVYTLNIDNETEVREVLKEVSRAPDPGGYLSFEFSARGMLQRVAVLVEKQDYCVRLPYSEKQTKYNLDLWPPLSALKKTSLSNPGEACTDACKRHGLICEPTFFPILNRMEAFPRFDVGAVCNSFEYGGYLEFPAINDVTKICYLQTNQRHFNCARNNLELIRLCPCRDSITEQTALCKDCLLP